MPRMQPVLCFTCNEQESVVYGQCSRCWVRFRREQPEEFQRWKAMTRAERATEIGRQRAVAEWKLAQAQGLPDFSKPWEYEGDEEALAKMCGQNSDESENQTGVEKRTSEIARNAN